MLCSVDTAPPPACKTLPRARPSRVQDPPACKTPPCARPSRVQDHPGHCHFGDSASFGPYVGAVTGSLGAKGEDMSGWHVGAALGRALRSISWGPSARVGRRIPNTSPTRGSGGPWNSPRRPSRTGRPSRRRWALTPPFATAAPPPTTSTRRHHACPGGGSRGSGRRSRTCVGKVCRRSGDRWPNATQVPQSLQCNTYCVQVVRGCALHDTKAVSLPITSVTVRTTTAWYMKFYPLIPFFSDRVGSSPNGIDCPPSVRVPFLLLPNLSSRDQCCGREVGCRPWCGMLTPRGRSMTVCAPAARRGVKTSHTAHPPQEWSGTNGSIFFSAMEFTTLHMKRAVGEGYARSTDVAGTGGGRGGTKGEGALEHHFDACNGAFAHSAGHSGEFTGTDHTTITHSKRPRAPANGCKNAALHRRDPHGRGTQPLGA